MDSNNKHEQTLKQSLCASFDGEASEFELQQTLQVSQKPEWRDYWKTLSAAQNARHSPEASQFLDLDISAAVRSAIELESPPGEPISDNKEQAGKPEKQNKKTWLKPFGGAAVAATVAAIMVLGVNTYQNTTQPELLAQQSVNSAVRVANPDYAATVSFGNPKVQLSKPQQNASLQKQKLEAYLLKHSQLNTLQSHQGLVPMARIESYEAASH